MKLTSHLIAVVAGVLVLYVVLFPWAPGWPHSLLLNWLRVLAGLSLLIGGPGLLFAVAARPANDSLFRLFALGFGLNTLLLILCSSLVTALGLPFCPPFLFFCLVLLTVGGAVLCLCTRQGVALDREAFNRSFTVLTCSLIAPLALLWMSPPFLAHDDQYFPLDTLRRLGEAEREGCAAPMSQVRTWHDVRWARLADPRQFRVEPGETTLAWFNEGQAATPVSLRLFIQAYGEGELALHMGDQINEEFYVQPRFDARQHPRNYPPPNFVITKTLCLAPGHNALRVTYRSSVADACLVVTDLSNLDQASFRREFRKRFIVDNIGDRQSNVELARNLLEHPWLYEHSYDGTRFDGGGYTISNLPFPYWLYHFALLLLGDDVWSIHLLYLAELAMLFLIIVRLGGYREGRPSWPLVVLSFGPVAAYGILMRFMIESTYVHTPMTLVFLLAIYFLLEESERPFLLFATLVLLTKGGAVLLALMFAAHFLVFRDKRRLAVSYLGHFALVAAALTAAVLAFGYFTDSLAAWRAELFGRDYGGRFSLVTGALRGQVSNLKYVSEAALRLTWQVLIGSCLLPLALLSRKLDKVAAFCALAVLPYHLVICLSNPSWQHSSYVTHHLNYFVPTAPLLAIAGLRQLATYDRRALVQLLIPAAVLALAALPCARQVVHGYETIYCRDISPVHERHYAYAVGNFFVRRADALSEHGDLDSMAREAEKVLKLDYYRGVRDEHLDRQRAYAHHLIGCNHARKKEFKAAVTRLRQALELDPTLTPASISLAGCLLDTGQRGAALEVIENGLKVAPEDTHLRPLRTKALAGG